MSLNSRSWMIYKLSRCSSYTKAEVMLNLKKISSKQLRIGPMFTWNFWFGMTLELELKSTDMIPLDILYNGNTMWYLLLLSDKACRNAVITSLCLSRLEMRASRRFSCRTKTDPANWTSLRRVAANASSSGRPKEKEQVCCVHCCLYCASVGQRNKTWLNKKNRVVYIAHL